MSAMMNRTQGNNQTANPEIWGLMEETKMESTNRALTGQLNISRNTTKSHLIRIVGVMAMGAILAASVLLSGSTVSADEAGRPLAKEQVTSVETWDDYADARDIHPKVTQVDSDFDAYIDARDIQNSGTGVKFSANLVRVDSDFDAYVDARDILNSGERLNFSNKLVSINSGAVGNWDTYADARDILPRVKQVSLADSNFDAYVDARDIPNSGERFNFSNKLVSINTGAVGNWDTYADARDILPKVKQVSLMDSDFDAYVDARDIR